MDNTQPNELAVSDKRPRSTAPIRILPTKSEEMLASPECPVCCDTGYVRYDVPVDHPQFGKIAPCQGPSNRNGCVVHGRIILKAMQAMTTLPADLVSMEASWETFPAGVDKRALTAMQRFTARVIAHDTKDLRGVLLYGRNQIGKTGMAYCTHKDLERAGIPSVFIGAIELMNRLHEAMMSNEGQARHISLLDRFSTVSNLVLDDLGAQRKTDFREEDLFLMLDRRSKDPACTTIITTNLDPSAPKDEDTESQDPSLLITAIERRSWSRIMGRTFKHLKVAGKICQITL